MRGLTKKQKQVLTFIKSAPANEPPSIREIMEGCGIKSTGHTRYVLDCLRSRGWIDWLPGKARTLRVLDGKLTPEQARMRAVRECIDHLESVPKCKTAVDELKKVLRRYQLEKEVYG